MKGLLLHHVLCAIPRVTLEFHIFGSVWQRGLCPLVGHAWLLFCGALSLTNLGPLWQDDIWLKRVQGFL